MPNKPLRDKRTSRRGSNARLRGQTTPQSAGEILARADQALPGLAEQLALHRSWREWLDTHLPAPLPGKLSGVVECDGCLTLLACSSAWSARLRYALRDIEPLIRAHAPRITEVRVRVQPRP
jgi:hypothetical protein